MSDQISSPNPTPEVATAPVPPAPQAAQPVVPPPAQPPVAPPAAPSPHKPFYTDPIFIGIVILVIILVLFKLGGNKKIELTATRNTTEETQEAKPTISHKVVSKYVTDVPYRKSSPTPFVKPKAPAGYSWRTCQDTKAEFLKPDGWYSKEETKSDTKACFYTKESIAAKGYFETGVTVNVVPDVKTKTGKLPSTYAREFVQKVADLQSGSKVVSEHPSSTLSGYSTLVTTTTQGKKIVMIQMAIGNDVTGTVYMVLFETPASEWDANKDYANTIMSSIKVDDSI